MEFSDALDEALEVWKEYDPEMKLLLAMGFHAG